MDEPAKRSVSTLIILMLGPLLTQQLFFQPRWFPLKSSRKKATISGEIQLQLCLLDTSDDAATPEQIMQKWTTWLSNFNGTPSPSASPSIYEQDDPLSRDLGDTGLSDDEEDMMEPDGALGRPKFDRIGTSVSMTLSIAPSITPSTMKGKTGGDKKGHHYELSRESDVVGVVFLEINSITDLPPEKNSKLDFHGVHANKLWLANAE